MINLKELVEVLEVEDTVGNLDIDITGIAYDSRKIRPGELFVAITGFEVDGHDFINGAIANGAQAVLVEKDIANKDVTTIKVSNTRKALARASAKFYDYPADDLTIIGVTGTNGKTTTTYLIESVLDNLGLKTGLIGTIKNKVGTSIQGASRTTPESLDIQRFFAQMREEGVTHAVMEVSSHALELGRVLEIDFDRQVFTNLSQDHLDFHQSLEDYLNAKLKLFTMNDKPAIINFDDQQADKIKEQARGEIISYGLEDEVDFKARDIKIDVKGVNYQLITKQNKLPVKLKLSGKFNVYNSLAAIATVASLGFDLTEIKEGIEDICGVPGRFQLIDQGQDFGVIVDYAHTPDGMENVLKTANEFTTGRVIVVFGCGGDRDRKKRPIMGRLGVTLADFAIVTSDNPRSEDPMDIIADIMPGINELEKKSGEDYIVIENRGEAINKAVEMANADDIILIIGKGHETYQDLGDKVIDFDDSEVAREALEYRSEE
ncbi:UDP-N-acetylmuramyl-tripeptide synthetase [Halobacteroides halobius DSM 5150]|uniref:UDP-N-acetylmuramoyl-L-alanyl-D-glutamate--2,6-diaminopimelate ligase n=1 Tax=Halobacteroides halobius (strain ATCC 35273 / DSM 5150 / MD-1) TaxID=748449 RepID=L0KBF2_HALHC|nr:UDP-N-acetylmuramoyl-L-alanyl-D-glutamate--2,6-diaminopimelate ligase [Halobacteroides halobius]AGB41709.1 UDP-N-acetylmuramyl-tripeptide synthetase [Halobacteroides halobius DSM 5150]